MASSYSSSIRLTLQGIGDNNNTWGTILNSGVFQLVDDANSGFVSIALTGDLTLSTANGSTDQARYKSWKFTGTLTTAATITLPSVGGDHKVWNATNKDLTFTTGAGNTVLVNSGDVTDIWCDGSNVKTVTFGGLDLKSYITAVAVTSGGQYPALAGNSGKYLYAFDNTTATWKQPAATDLSDYTALVGKAAAFAIALGRRG